MSDPKGNGNNGRDGRGRFTPGNRGGPGNPYARRTAELRSALYRAIGPDDVAAIIQSLLAAARKGDVAAAKLVLAYAIGEPVAHDLAERIELLEERLGCTDAARTE